MTLRAKAISLIGSLVFSATAVASPAKSETFSQAFNQLLETHQLPGAVVMIKHQDKLVHAQAYGKVNVEQPQSMEQDALFRIFSMSKPITAVAMLQLVDKGLVKLDADIREYLPEFEPFEYDGKKQLVTVHHLLSHTAGFGYGGGLKNWVDIRYLLANPLSRSNTNAEMIEDISGIDLKFAPGERFEYSIASDIQGALIEAVTDMPLDQYLKEHIFAPLEMVDTGFYVPESQQHRLVDMYEYDASTFEEAYVFNREKILFSERGDSSEYLEKPDLLSAGGGLVSTANDYSNFVSMLLNKGRFNGKTLLSETLIDAMLSSHTTGLDTHFMPRVYKGTGFGYGIGVKEVSGDPRNQGTFFWGGMGGTIFWADPVADVQVVVMMQVEDGWIALEKWMIPEVYKLIAPEA